jgi:hypothetical protein
MLAVLLVVQMPHGIRAHWARPIEWGEASAMVRAEGVNGLAKVVVWDGHVRSEWQEQQRVLRQIEEVDAVCRESGIDAATAREALPWLKVPGGSGPVNGWDYLRGSPAPRTTDAKEVRELLRRFRDAVPE